MSGISTSYISNAALGLTFNQFWAKADDNGNGSLSEQEFVDIANFSIARAGRMFVSDDKIRSYYRSIANGSEIRKDTLLQYIQNYFGVNLNSSPNDTIETIIDRYNVRQKFNYNAGESVGQKIFDEVSGIGDGKVCDILKNMVDENNVMQTVEDFNHISSSKGRENIMQYIDNEWGPTAKEMDVIPKSLLKLAKNLNLSNTPQYKNLKDVMKEDNSWTGDYGSTKASHLDRAINNLIRRIHIELHN